MSTYGTYEELKVILNEMYSNLSPSIETTEFRCFIDEIEKNPNLTNNDLIDYWIITKDYQRTLRKIPINSPPLTSVLEYLPEPIVHSPVIPPLPPIPIVEILPVITDNSIIIFSILNTVNCQFIRGYHTSISNNLPRPNALVMELKVPGGRNRINFINTIISRQGFKLDLLDSYIEPIYGPTGTIG